MSEAKETLTESARRDLSEYKKVIDERYAQYEENQEKLNCCSSASRKKFKKAKRQHKTLEVMFRSIGNIFRKMEYEPDDDKLQMQSGVLNNYLDELLKLLDRCTWAIDSC